MTDFDKKDIPALDFIINKLVAEDFQVNTNDLIKAKIIEIDGSSNEEWEKAEIEFVRLMYIISSYNCANCFTASNSDIGAKITSNSKTSYFKASGGFQNAYDEILKEKAHTQILKTKERNEAKLFEWQIKTFWPIFILGIFGGAYSVFDLLNKSKEDKKEVVTKSELQKEVQKLQLLILDYKKIDSIRNLKTSKLKNESDNKKTNG